MERRGSNISVSSSQSAVSIYTTLSESDGNHSLPAQIQLQAKHLI